MNIAGPFFSVLFMAARFGIWLIITFLKLVYKLRLTGIFLWICGWSYIYWNEQNMIRYEKYLGIYYLLGILVVIGTILAMFTAIVQFWKPGFRFLDLITGAPEQMDLRYFQGVETLEELETMYINEALCYKLDGNMKQYKKLNREYHYLKRKLEEKKMNQ